MKYVNKKKSRREFIEKVSNPKTSKILEIGALNSPTFSETEVEVAFADWKNQEELIEAYPHKSGIRKVDYIIQGRELSDFVEGNFDIIITNHVIEHIPDIIFWFQELDKISTPNARLTFGVPDKRYTFDYFRPLTKLSEILECYHNKIDKPTFSQIFEHQYLYQKVDVKKIWEGEQVIHQGHRYSLKSAFDKTKSMLSEYHSVHCHVFDYNHFLKTFDELSKFDFFNWKIHSSSDVQPGLNEFLVAFVKKN